jgi:hypothetical protein
MGVDLDRLACFLHHPTVYDHQTSGQSFLSGAALPHRVSVVLSIWVPVLLNLTWRGSHFPGHAYPTSELSQ